MSIERNEPIRFHEKGTLEAVTRWIATHNDGVAEWLKNVRRQYQVDRANVAENQRVAALFIGLGHYRSHLQQVARVLLERAKLLDRLLPELLPTCTWSRGVGSTNYWVCCPAGTVTMAMVSSATNSISVSKM